ncbi:unnamed protein product [Caenorhabditis angaria]|uniref:Uncharacterized protein n=1 Tax=Caenorhabditis angaria TaxID=860376 RepID=A0A9P1I4Q8_9PELO|nr:unnamed protein product [Caenorhabditis angaria]
MFSIVIIIFLLFTCDVSTKNADLEIKKLLGEDIPQINTTQEAVDELTNHWVEQALSALISAAANNKLATVSHIDRRMHEKCIKDIKTIEEHAKCVSELLEVSRANIRKHEGNQKIIKKLMEIEDGSWIGAFRIRKKRQTNIISKSNYVLKSSKDVSPFTMVAKQITKTVRAMKNKKEDRNWRQIMVDVKKTGEVIENRKKVKEMLGKSVRSRGRPERYDERKPLAHDDIEDYDSPVTTSKPVIDTDKLFQRLQDHPEDILNDNAADVFNMTDENAEAVLRIKLIREAVKLGLQVGGQNTSDFDKKSLRFASPRFFAITPEEHKKDNDTINVLSPSLFSLHDEGTDEERKTALSNLLPDLQKGGGEKDAWMDMLTEISGVADTVDDAATKVARESEGVLMNTKGEEINVSKENITNIYGEEGYRKMKVIEKLNGMYTKQQMEQFNTTGFAIMTDEQKEIMYGKGAPYENLETIQASKNLTMTKAKKALHTTIKGLAEGDVKLGKYDKRMKDIVLSPLILTSIVANPAAASQALILSPVLFTSLILSPAIYGSVILSPWLFVPVILAPRVLSPIIVSPAIFSPIILSPLALDALVLVPGVANPFVLSPFVLCPFILSPQVMTPLILSPFALSPFILTPTALSPLVLSPFVLSPSVLSPSFVTAVILSPYALSPSVLSPPTMISVFASPSILS